MIGLLGKKLGSSRVYDARGVLVPVTIVQVGPNRVLQCKTQESDGYNAVQLGFDDQKEQRLPKALLGHIKKQNGTAVKRTKQFSNFTLAVIPVDCIGAAIFLPGRFIDPIGVPRLPGPQAVENRPAFPRVHPPRAAPKTSSSSPGCGDPTCSGIKNRSRSLSGSGNVPS